MSWEQKCFFFFGLKAEIEMYLHEEEDGVDGEIGKDMNCNAL